MEDASTGVIITQTEERTKIVIPTKVNWFLFVVYTTSLLIWLAMLVLVLQYLFRGQSSSFVFTALLLLWALVWLWFGRFLWGRWQFHVANREILYIDEEQLIVRRPVSIFGITTGYDLGHLSPFYYSDKHNCPAFDYAYLHVYFGQGLSDDQAAALVDQLNEICFPEQDEERESLADDR